QTHECGDAAHTNAETTPDHMSMIPARCMGPCTISADDGSIFGRVTILPHVKCNAAAAGDDHGISPSAAGLRTGTDLPSGRKRREGEERQAAARTLTCARAGMSR